MDSELFGVGFNFFAKLHSNVKVATSQNEPNFPLCFIRKRFQIFTQFYLSLIRIFLITFLSENSQSCRFPGCWIKFSGTLSWKQNLETTWYWPCQDGKTPIYFIPPFSCCQKKF